MGIDKTWKDDFAGAVNLANLPAVLLYPGVAQGVLGLADRDDLAADRENGAVFDQAEIAEVASAARALCRGTQSQKLANVDQKQRAGSAVSEGRVSRPLW